MAITAQMVKELRLKTGAGMMDCKKALKETDGNVEEAIDFLRKKGLSSAAKKAGRSTNEGIIKILAKDTKAIVIEMNCETDFVARTDDFLSAANLIAEKMLENDIQDIENLPTDIDDIRKAAIGKLGENMAVSRAQIVNKEENGYFADYIHMGGKIGVLVQFTVDQMGDEAAMEEAGKNVAMHVAATAPLAVTQDDIDPAAIEREKEIYREQGKNEGKPEAIVEKIIVGRLKKYFAEVCLVEQQYVKNPDQTIAQYLAEEGKKHGFTMTPKNFVRFKLGEE